MEEGGRAFFELAPLCNRNFSLVLTVIYQVQIDKTYILFCNRDFILVLTLIYQVQIDKVCIQFCSLNFIKISTPIHPFCQQQKITNSS